MTSPIWMPLYVKDYLADNMYLTTEEHGAYFLLIMQYWKNGGPLADDLDEIKKFTGLSKYKFEKFLPLFLKLFSHSETHYHHKRIDAELLKAAELSQKRAKAGAKGGSNSKANAKQLLTQSQSQSQSQEAKASKPPIVPLKDLDLTFEKLWSEWPKKSRHRSSRKKVKAHLENACRNHQIEPIQVLWSHRHWMGTQKWDNEGEYIHGPDPWFNNETYNDFLEFGEISEAVRPINGSGHSKNGNGRRPKPGLEAFADAAAEIAGYADQEQSESPGIDYGGTDQGKGPVIDIPKSNGQGNGRGSGHGSDEAQAALPRSGFDHGPSEKPN